MARMKMALRRILSCLLTGATVLLVPKIVDWVYYGYLALTGLFAIAFPLISLVFSFVNKMLYEAAGAGLGGLLVTLLVFGIGILTIKGSEKLYPSVLGGRFLIAGILSLCLAARNGFSLRLIFQEMGFRNGILSFQGAVLFLTVVAQIIDTVLFLGTFHKMGSLQLLLGNKKWMVFVDMPKDVHDAFSVFAYVSDMGGLMAGDNKPGSQAVKACLTRALQSGILAKHSDCLLCDAALVRKDAVRLKDVIQVHQEGGEVSVNPDTPFCESLRTEAKNGLVFITLQNARML